MVVTHSFADYLKLKKINDTSGNVFNEFGDRIVLDTLSTGEKSRALFYEEVQFNLYMAVQNILRTKGSFLKNEDKVFLDHIATMAEVRWSEKFNKEDYSLVGTQYLLKDCSNARTMADYYKNDFTGRILNGLLEDTIKEKYLNKDFFYEKELEYVGTELTDKLELPGFLPKSIPEIRAAFNIPQDFITNREDLNDLIYVRYRRLCPYDEIYPQFDLNTTVLNILETNSEVFDKLVLPGGFIDFYGICTYYSLEFQELLKQQISLNEKLIIDKFIQELITKEGINLNLLLECSLYNNPATKLEIYRYHLFLLDLNINKLWGVFDWKHSLQSMNLNHYTQFVLEKDRIPEMPRILWENKIMPDLEIVNKLGFPKTRSGLIKTAEFIESDLNLLKNLQEFIETADLPRYKIFDELSYNWPHTSIMNDISSITSCPTCIKNELSNAPIEPITVVLPKVLDILGQWDTFNFSRFLATWELFIQKILLPFYWYPLSINYSILLIFGTIVCLIICMLIAIAYYTLAERKVMAFMQRRRGPNVVGFWGLLQPLADGMKLLFKEILIPRKANYILFLFAPILTFILALVSWTVIPFSEFFVLADIPLGIIFLLTISSLGVYGIIIAGWASNSNYAFLGALRSTAQMISYEITISFVVLTVVFFVGSYNLTDIVTAQVGCWFVFPLFPIVFIFFICMLAETNRAPFDLPEAEAELVAGYNVDYSSITFALFFLGEYANMLLMSALMVILFFGGWLPFYFLTSISGEFLFALKLGFFAFLFIWVRATLPRYRYDQLMTLGWKMFLPFTFGFFLFIFGIFSSSGVFVKVHYWVSQINTTFILFEQFILWCNCQVDFLPWCYDRIVDREFLTVANRFDIMNSTRKSSLYMNELLVTSYFNLDSNLLKESGILDWTSLLIDKKWFLSQGNWDIYPQNVFLKDNGLLLIKGITTFIPDYKTSSLSLIGRYEIDILTIPVEEFKRELRFHFYGILTSNSCNLNEFFRIMNSNTIFYLPKVNNALTYNWVEVCQVLDIPVGDIAAQRKQIFNDILLRLSDYELQDSFFRRANYDLFVGK